MTHPLLARAEAGGTPVIDGDTATLIWQGAAPPVLVSDLTGWEPEHPAEWTEVAPGIWSHTMTPVPDAYIEYAFLAGAAGDERTPDPFNSRTTPNGIGQINHFFYMPAGAATPLAQRIRGVPSGAVTRHVVEHKVLVVGGKRPVWLYQPPTADPVPLVVVFDGGDYYRRGRLTQIVDNLINQGRIRPLALALVENGGQARVVEYACSDATVGFIMECVLPLAAKRLRLTDMHTAPGSPGAYGILGASMGGLMALYTGLRLTHIFGHVLSQSGAFWRGPLPWVVETLARDGAVRPLKIWLDVGRYEWLLPGNRDLHELLAERGYAVTYREFSGGHNYPAWRDDVWRGLEQLFPAERNQNAT
jgi:enterochelin esterase family protein